MTSFHISVKSPDQLTPEVTTSSSLGNVPDQITQLGLTRHTWDSLRNAIVAALRTPNEYNVGLEGYGLEWEAWLDEFLDGGVGDRFWPEKGMPLCWKEDRVVIREAVKSQALSIAAEERNSNVIGESSNGLPTEPRTTRMFNIEISSTQGRRSPNQQPTASFSGSSALTHDKTDEAKIYTRKTRAVVKKLQELERPERWSYTPVFGEDKLEDKGAHEVNQKIADVGSSYRNGPDFPRPRRGPVRAKKTNGWVAVNEVGQDVVYTHDKPITIKRPASEEPISTPVKRKRKKISTSRIPDHPIELPSESVTNSENQMPTPCLTPTTPSTPVLVSELSSLVLETRLTTSSKIKFIYATDTPSLSHFLEKFRQKWMLSGTQRVCSIEIEMGNKVFDVDLKEERDWRVALGIMEKWGEEVKVVIGVAE